MTNNTKINCKFFDTIDSQPVCYNPWIKGMNKYSDGFVPHCPFKNTKDACIYCRKFESNVKYRVKFNETVISGIFKSKSAAQQFVDSLTIEEIYDQ